MPDDLVINLDLRPVIEANKEIEKEILTKLKASAKLLAIQTHGHVKEEAASRLHTRRDMFLEHLHFEQVSENLWSITIDEKGMWIEEGQEPHSMLEDLLKSPKAKRAKDGSKYIVIPFKQNKAPTQSTPAQKELVKVLKKELRGRDISYSKIERNPDGSPKTGLLHKFDAATPPQQHRVGMGMMGPQGRKQQTDTPNPGHAGPAGRPYLAGVRIYQKLMRNPDGSVKQDAQGHAKATREIFTFRVASSKQLGTNKWFHPGSGPMHFLDEAYRWAMNEWDTKIAPEMLSSLELT
jgi:hypothetical protein